MKHLLIILSGLIIFSCSDYPDEPVQEEAIAEDKFLSCICKDTNEAYGSLNYNCSDKQIISVVNESSNTFEIIASKADFEKEYEEFFPDENQLVFFSDLMEKIALREGAELIENSTKFDEYQITRTISFNDVEARAKNKFSYILNRLSLEVQAKNIYEPERKVFDEIAESNNLNYLYQCSVIDKL